MYTVLTAYSPILNCREILNYQSLLASIKIGYTNAQAPARLDEATTSITIIEKGGAYGLIIRNDHPEARRNRDHFLPSAYSDPTHLTTHIPQHVEPLGHGRRLGDVRQLRD